MPKIPQRLTVVLCLLTFSTVSSIASAQRISDLKAAARVRVTRVHGGRVVGEFAGVAEDSLSVWDEGSPTAVTTSINEITRVEVSGGRSKAKGALVKGAFGFGIGALSGAVIGASGSVQKGKGSCLAVCSRSETAGVGALGGGYLGLAIGTVIGLATGQESWNAVQFK